MSSSNLIQSQLLQGSKLIIFPTLSTLPVIGQSNIVYYITVDSSNSNRATSYQYISGAYVKLSDNPTDMSFYDTMITFPSIGSINTLYVLNGFQYIYYWDGTLLQYTFLCQASSLIAQMLLGVQISYTSPAIVPTGITLNTTYTIGFDTLPYVISGNSPKVYMIISDIENYFTPLSGETFSEIIGSNPLPVDPIIPPASIDSIINFREIYDQNADGIIDRCSSADSLQGFSPAYFTAPVTANTLSIANKVKSYTYTCTVSSQTNVIFGGLAYDPLHDELNVTFSGILLDLNDNYTLNSNNISIDLGWSLDIGNQIKFQIIKNTN